MIHATTTATEKRLIHTLQLLGDKTRFQIFKLISTNENLCVGAIASDLAISSSAVSQHFRQFELLELVEKERMGQKICYSLRKDDELVMELKQLMKLS